MDPFLTERLSVHSWQSTLGDREARRGLEIALSAILSRRVLEHLPSPLHLSGDDDIASWVDERAEESDVFRVNWRHSSELVGLLILASDPSDSQAPELHIGYLLGEATWGQGVATELVQGLVSAAEKDGPVRLLGGVSIENPASARVLEKAGFELSPDLSTTNSHMYSKKVG